MLKAHQKYLGFSHEGQIFVYKVLPFGLSTSVSSFIRALSKILGPEIEGFVIPYVDDLLVYSSNVKQHMRHLEIIFEKFRCANVTVKFKKILFRPSRDQFSRAYNYH